MLGIVLEVGYISIVRDSRSYDGDTQSSVDPLPHNDVLFVSMQIE